MPEAAPAPQAPATPPPVSRADEQRALIARENGTTYDAASQTFNEPAPTDSGTTPASGEPAQKSTAQEEPKGESAATSEAQGDTSVEDGGDVGSAGDKSEGETEPSAPGKNHVARKIDKLTRENAEMRRALQQLAVQQQAPQQPQRPAPADPKPDPAKYTDVAQFIADTSAWASRQEAQKTVGRVFGQLAQQAAQAQQIQQAHQQVQEFNDRVSKGSDEIKDFKQVTTASADVEVAPHVAASIMQGVENPAVVLYHLAKNPAEVTKLNSMPPAKVAVRLGAIEANAKRPPAVSNAPKPATQVAAKGGVPSGYSDEMSMRDFVAWRKGSPK